MARNSSRLKRTGRSGDPRLRDGLDEAEALMERRRWMQASTLLHELEREFPNRPEILRLLLDVAANLNDSHAYRSTCERLYELCPSDLNLPYMLGRIYLNFGWFTLAQSMCRLALKQAPTHELARETRRMLADLGPMIDEHLVLNGLNGPDAIECLTMHDQIRSLMPMSRFARAHEIAEQLIALNPGFTPAYNNGAEAYYHDGEFAKAVALTERLLAFEPNNVYALANLVRYLTTSGKVEDARRHAERLKGLRPPVKDHAVKQVEALSWLGDDAGVLELLEQGLEFDGIEKSLDNCVLYHLAAVAAFRLGREEDARSYWQSSLQAVPSFELAIGNLNDLKRPIGDRNVPWNYSLAYLVPKKLIDELLNKLLRGRGKVPDETLQREQEDYLAAHPELEGLVPLLLDHSDSDGRELALRLAGLIRTPAMLRALRDFALGTRGTDTLRLRAYQIVDEAGMFAPGPRRLWLNGSWRTVTVETFEIHFDAVERSYANGVLEMIGAGIAALNAGDPARAERSFRRALAIDPDDPVVLNNLAMTCSLLGRTDESEAITIRLHERHPDYLFGRTALAGLAAQRGELDRARELLMPLLSRRRIHIAEFSALCMAEVNLHLAAGDLQQVEHWLGMWREAAPDHPSLDSFTARLRSTLK